MTAELHACSKLGPSGAERSGAKVGALPRLASLAAQKLETILCMSPMCHATSRVYLHRIAECFQRHPEMNLNGSHEIFRPAHSISVRAPAQRSMNEDHAGKSCRTLMSASFIKFPSHRVSAVHIFVHSACLIDLTSLLRALSTTVYFLHHTSRQRAMSGVIFHRWGVA